MSTTATFIALNAARTATVSHGLAAGVVMFSPAEIVFLKVCVGLLIASGLIGFIAGYWLEKRDRFMMGFFMFFLAPMIVACVEIFVYGAWKGVEFILS